MPLPEGAIDASEFNASLLDPNTHLFFDDDRKYIDPVQTRMNKEGTSLACVYCRPPETIVLHAHDTGSAVTEIKQPNTFREMKQLGTPVGAFRDFLGYNIEEKIGTGFTSAMISQLIDFETSLRAAESKRTPRRLYFFDFDRTLTFAPGMSFAFLPKKSKTRSAPPMTEIPESERFLLSQYAKYLFSDYCGEEPARGGGRMSLLRQLFTVIGNKRIYIVTANSSAKNAPENPYFLHFKFLITQLLPDFLEDHIVGVRSTNEAPLNSKQDAIASILQRSPRSPRSPGGTAVTKKSPRSPRSPGGTAATKKSPRSPGGTAATKKSPSSSGRGGGKSRRIRRSTRKRRK
jgi:hypothetical protein